MQKSKTSIMMQSALGERINQVEKIIRKLYYFNFTRGKIENETAHA